MTVTINQLPQAATMAAGDEVYLQHSFLARTSHDRSYKATAKGLSRSVVLAKGGCTMTGEMYEDNFGISGIERIAHGVYEYTLDAYFDVKRVQMFAGSRLCSVVTAYCPGHSHVSYAENKIRLVQYIEGQLITSDNWLLVLRPAI